MTSPVYLLTGEPFLADEALAKVRAEAASDPLSELSFDPSVEPAELIGALQTSSLFGSRRLVIVRDAEQLKKEHADALSAYLEDPSPDSVLVLIAQARTRLDAAVKRRGAVVALEPPRGRRLVGWLRQRGRDRGLTVDDRGAWAMIDAVGPELRDLDSALAQLSTGLGPAARVGVAEVRSAFPRLADERIYVFTDAVGERRLPAAMAALTRLLQQGDDPLLLFGALAGQIRRMLRARRHADRGVADVADALGLPGWRAERLQRQARTYREDELVAALEVLAATDIEMKGGDVPPEAALERAVVEIVGSAGR